MKKSKGGWIFLLLLAGAAGWSMWWYERAGQLPEPPTPEPPVIRRYRAPSASPNFDRPFDYAGAVSGNIPVLKSSSGARSGILVDLDSHRVLWEKNSREAQPIASLTKLMTFLVVMDELEKGDRPNFDSPVTVSTDSTNANPVKINLRAGEKVPLRDLMTAMMMMSANDAAQQIAEYFGDGRMAGFVELMNLRAGEIGMTESVFHNPNGLPIYRKNAETLMNRASPLDMMVLIEHVFEYPQLFEWTNAKQRNYREGTAAARELGNSNRLLGAVPGVDGLKTGYTDAAGHCLAFSAVRNGRRLVGVALGFDKRDDLFAFSREAIEWGYQQQ